MENRVDKDFTVKFSVLEKEIFIRAVIEHTLVILMSVDMDSEPTVHREYVLEKIKSAHQRGIFAPQMLHPSLHGVFLARIKNDNAFKEEYMKDLFAIIPRLKEVFYGGL